MAAPTVDPIEVTDICCIGAGYVGAITMTIIAQHCPNIRIVVVDVNQAKIDQWNSDDLPIYEPGLKEIILATRDKNLFFSTDVDGSIRKAQIIFIAVDTNTKKYGVGAGSAYDLTSTEAVARKIAHVALTSKIVVEKSTVPVRTCERISAILNENQSHPDLHFEVLSNPEFLAEGEAVRNLREPSRIVIGCRESPEGYAAAAALVSIYRHWVPVERILTTKSFSAELAKIASNAFLAQRISSINAISSVCEATGADINEVAKAIGMDTRLGSRFLQTSLGFGGSCFKKDLMALVYLCEFYQLNEVAMYWKQVIMMNEHQKSRFAKQIYDVMNGTLAGKRIVLFGFAFKKNTEDIRESPAIDVARVLLEERAEVVVYDPKVHLQTIHQLGEPFTRVVKVHDPYAACAKAHAIIVVTEWDEFITYDYKRIFESMVRPAHIFDGRNLLSHDDLAKIGFRVHAIGRPHNRHAH